MFQWSPKIVFICSLKKHTEPEPFQMSYILLELTCSQRHIRFQFLRLMFCWFQAANLDAIGSKKEIEFWQTFFERILQGAKDPNNLASIFKPIAQPHLQSFAMSIARYLQEDFDVLRKTEASVAEKIHTNCRAARKQLCSFKRSL